MYTLIIMASLQKKNSRGHIYWQIVESRRVNGKPRPIVLMHLGTAETLLRRLQQSPDKPIDAKVFEFGAVAALWDIAQRLEVVSIIDGVIAKRNQGLSCGQYILLATINRCVAASSKAALYDWYRNTSLQRIFPVSKASLSSQRFWDHMSYITQEHIQEIEKQLTSRIVADFDVSLNTLLFDATNFDTFIDTQTQCQIAQRGRAKSKRSDLRIIGLALMVSTDFNVPLFSHPYPGNQNDPTTFSEVVDSLIGRLSELSEQCEHITLVFDGGNNSEDNIKSLDISRYHFITSLTLSHHKELLEVPLNKYETFSEEPRLEGCSAYRTVKKVWNQERTVVVTQSKALLHGQIAGIEHSLKKRRKALRELRTKLKRSQKQGAKGKGYTEESLNNHLKTQTSGQYISEVLKTQVTKTPGGDLDFRFWTDQSSYTNLKNTRLGKRILCTDNHEWNTAEIILGSRAQHHVENAFRQMKDPHWISFSPSFHWTDQKLRVHVFYCVLALTLTTLLQKQAAGQKIKLSVEQLLKQLSGIKEVATFYPSKPKTRGSLRSEYVLTKRTAVQKKLSRIFNLEELTHR